MAEHIYYESSDFKIGMHDDWFQVNIVDGGLALCKVCRGLEGGLTTECPGEVVANVVQDDVYFGRMDFINGKWLVGALNPTNKVWLYGRYINYSKSDEEFLIKEGISLEYFNEIKQEWIDKGYKMDKRIK